MKDKDELTEKIEELIEERLVDVYDSPGHAPLRALDEEDLQNLLIDMKLLLDELEKRQQPIKLKKEMQRMNPIITEILSWYTYQ